MYNIIALMGEAGSGKDRVLREVMADFPHTFNEIISFTSRPPRENEIHGKNYYFLTEEEFANNICKNKMIEYTKFNDWYYGTGYDSLVENKINLGVFNPDGVRILFENKEINLTVIKIVTKDKTRLIRQLTREENPNIEEIFRRFKADKYNFNQLDFDYIELNNENLDDLNAILVFICNLAERIRKDNFNSSN
jgi:guanylate kinase